MALMVKNSTGNFIEKLLKEEKKLKITVSIVAETEVRLSKDIPINKNKQKVILKPSSTHNLSKDLQLFNYVLSFYFLKVIT